MFKLHPPRPLVFEAPLLFKGANHRDFLTGFEREDLLIPHSLWSTWLFKGSDHCNCWMGLQREPFFFFYISVSSPLLHAGLKNQTLDDDAKKKNTLRHHNFQEAWPPRNFYTFEEEASFPFPE